MQQVHLLNTWPVATLGEPELINHQKVPVPDTDVILVIVIEVVIGIKVEMVITWSQGTLTW